MSITSFLGEVKVELEKVVWPTRTEALQYTATVVVISFIMAAILGAFDFGLLKLFEKLLTK